MSKRILALMTMVALVSIALAACGGSAEPAAAPAAAARVSPPVVPPANTTAPAPAASTDSSDSGSGTPVTVALQDQGGNYKFDSSEFTFKAGETVSFTLTAESEFHTFTVSDLGIDVSVDAGSPETLTFTFDKPGVYELICVPHEALGMIGTITVQ